MKVAERRRASEIECGGTANEMKVYAEVNDREILLALQASVRAVRGLGAGMEINLMNMADASARTALRENPLDCVPMNSEVGGRVVLVITGWSQFADALFQQALRVAHYSAKPTRIIVVSADTARLRSKTLAEAPGLEDERYVADIMSVEFVPAFSHADLALAEKDIVTLAFCGGDPDKGFAQSIHLSEAPFPGLRQIFLEIPDGSGYREVLNNPSFRNRRIRTLPVGSHAKAFELAEKLDQQAKESHRRYLEHRGEKRLRSPDGRGYLDESDYDWEDLDEIRRGWNRSPTDHARIKLRALADFHGVSRPVGDDTTIDPFLSARISEITAHMTEKLKGHLPDLELLSRIEHDRWVGEKTAEGWRYAEKKNAAKKLSPYLVPYESLSEEVKQYDRNQVMDQLNQVLQR